MPCLSQLRQRGTNVLSVIGRRVSIYTGMSLFQQLRLLYGRNYAKHPSDKCSVIVVDLFANKTTRTEDNPYPRQLVPRQIIPPF